MASQLPACTLELTAPKLRMMLGCSQVPRGGSCSFRTAVMLYSSLLEHSVSTEESWALPLFPVRFGFRSSTQECLDSRRKGVQRKGPEQGEVSPP